MARTGIALFAIAAALVVGSVVIVGDPNPFEEIDDLSDQFTADPTTERLRDLLNYSADGSYSYYHMAVLGRAFDRSPHVYRAVWNTPQAETERRAIEKLAKLGKAVFEYHPEIEPSGFEERFQTQRWLESARTK